MKLFKITYLFIISKIIIQTSICSMHEAPVNKKPELTQFKRNAIATRDYLSNSIIPNLGVIDFIAGTKGMEIVNNNIVKTIKPHENNNFITKEIYNNTGKLTQREFEPHENNNFITIEQFNDAGDMIYTAVQPDPTKMDKQIFYSNDFSQEIYEKEKELTFNNTSIQYRYKLIDNNGNKVYFKDFYDTTPYVFDSNNTYQGQIKNNTENLLHLNFSQIEDVEKYQKALQNIEKDSNESKKTKALKIS